MDNVEIIETKHQALCRRLGEACATLVGVITVARATGMSRTTIYTGLAGLKVVSPVSPQQIPARIRAAGGGRKKRTAKDVNLLRDLEALFEPASRGVLPLSAMHFTVSGTAACHRELLPLTKFV